MQPRVILDTYTLPITLSWGFEALKGCSSPLMSCYSLRSQRRRCNVGRTQRLRSVSSILHREANIWTYIHPIRAYRQRFRTEGPLGCYYIGGCIIRRRLSGIVVLRRWDLEVQTLWIPHTRGCSAYKDVYLYRNTLVGMISWYVSVVIPKITMDGFPSNNRCDPYICQGIGHSTEYDGDHGN